MNEERTSYRIAKKFAKEHGITDENIIERIAYLVNQISVASTYYIRVKSGMTFPYPTAISKIPDQHLITEDGKSLV